MASSLFKRIKSNAKSTIIIMGTIFFDAVIMIIWAGLQCVVDWCIRFFEPTGFSLLTCKVFQVLLALSTLIKVFEYLAEDIILIVKKLRMVVKKSLPVD